MATRMGVESNDLCKSIGDEEGIQEHQASHPLKERCLATLDEKF